MAKKPKIKEEKPLEFTLTRSEKPVTIDGRKYVLIEMDGKQRDAYLNGMGQRIRHTPEGKPAGLKDYNGLQASLVASCLHEEETAESPNRKPVAINTVQSYPARVLSALYDACKEMNDLDEEEEGDETEKGNE